MTTMMTTTATMLTLRTKKKMRARRLRCRPASCSTERCMAGPFMVNAATPRHGTTSVPPPPDVGRVHCELRAYIKEPERRATRGNNGLAVSLGTQAARESHRKIVVLKDDRSDTT